MLDGAGAELAAVAVVAVAVAASSVPVPVVLFVGEPAVAEVRASSVLLYAPFSNASETGTLGEVDGGLSNDGPGAESPSKPISAKRRKRWRNVVDRLKPHHPDPSKPHVCTGWAEGVMRKSQFYSICM